MHWLLPANTKFYDVFGAFSKTTTYWPMSANLSIGDVVYIYLAAPYKQIGFICEVKKIGLDFDEIWNNIQPFVKNTKGSDKKSKPFMLLKKVRAMEINQQSPLANQFLKLHGLNGMLMGPRKLENNQILLDYIKGNLT